MAHAPVCSLGLRLDKDQLAPGKRLRGAVMVHLAAAAAHAPSPATALLVSPSDRHDGAESETAGPSSASPVSPSSAVCVARGSGADDGRPLRFFWGPLLSAHPTLVLRIRGKEKGIVKLLPQKTMRRYLTHRDVTYFAQEVGLDMRDAAGVAYAQARMASPAGAPACPDAFSFEVPFNVLLPASLPPSACCETPHAACSLRYRVQLAPWSAFAAAAAVAGHALGNVFNSGEDSERRGNADGALSRVFYVMSAVRRREWEEALAAPLLLTPSLTPPPQQAFTSIGERLYKSFSKSFSKSEQAKHLLNGGTLACHVQVLPRILVVGEEHEGARACRRPKARSSRGRGRDKRRQLKTSTTSSDPNRGRSDVQPRQGHRRGGTPCGAARSELSSSSSSIARPQRRATIVAGARERRGIAERHAANGTRGVGEKDNRPAAAREQSSEESEVIVVDAEQHNAIREIAPSTVAHRFRPRRQPQHPRSSCSASPSSLPPPPSRPPAPHTAVSPARTTHANPQVPTRRASREYPQKNVHTDVPASSRDEASTRKRETSLPSAATGAHKTLSQGQTSSEASTASSSRRRHPAATSTSLTIGGGGGAARGDAAPTPASSPAAMSLPHACHRCVKVRVTLHNVSHACPVEAVRVRLLQCGDARLFGRKGSRPSVTLAHADYFIAYPPAVTGELDQHRDEGERRTAATGRDGADPRDEDGIDRVAYPFPYGLGIGDHIVFDVVLELPDMLRYSEDFDRALPLPTIQTRMLQCETGLDVLLIRRKTVPAPLWRASTAKDAGGHGASVASRVNPWFIDPDLDHSRIFHADCPVHIASVLDRKDEVPPLPQVFTEKVVAQEDFIG